MKQPAGLPGLLPYGVDDHGHVVVAWRDRVVDLARLRGLDVGPEVWRSGSLNAFFRLGPDAWTRTRQQLITALTAGDDATSARRHDRPAREVRLILPFEVADYTDFYACEAHAARMGRLLRPGTPPLPPSWRHLPIGYHGRSATVVVSGSPIPRPCGLRLVHGRPEFGPSQRLDVEVELGFVIGRGNRRGHPIAVDDAADHVFGIVVVNDWSARDIQAFEYQPLGPFLGKSFATSVSPWVVPQEALAPYRVEGPLQEPLPAAYLRVQEPRGFDIRFALCLNGAMVSTTNASNLYWSMAQMVAHLTVNGACLRPGDLLASGTISGDEPQTQGSLMELTENGAAPIVLPGGSRRTWLEDGDSVVIEAWCGDHGVGAVRGKILAAGTSRGEEDE